MEKWLIGVLVTIVSALFSTIGLLMQKYAHMKEAELMKKSGGTKGYFKCCGIPCNAWFVTGFIVLAFVPLPLDFIALSNAGQSLIIPVGTGMTIVWNQILSPLVLKEKFSRQDAFATIIIVIGVLVSTLFGTHASPSYPASTLISFLGEPAFIMLVVFAFFSTAFALSILHVKKVQRYFSHEIHLLAVGYAPAVFGSMQIMCFKVVGELNKNTFEGIEVGETNNVNGTEVKTTKRLLVNEFESWKIYTFLLLVILLAIYQFKYMNLGLSLHHAIKYLPIYNTFLLISSVVVGSIFFQEYETFHPIAFPIGCVLLVVGIRQLAHQQMARVDPMLLESPPSVNKKHVGDDINNNADDIDGDEIDTTSTPQHFFRNEPRNDTGLAKDDLIIPNNNSKDAVDNIFSNTTNTISAREDFSFDDDQNFVKSLSTNFLLPHESGFTPAVSDSVKKSNKENVMFTNMDELTPVKNSTRVHQGASESKDNERLLQAL
eukprot:g6704.t1